VPELLNGFGPHGSPTILKSLSNATGRGTSGVSLLNHGWLWRIINNKKLKNNHEKI